MAQLTKEQRDELLVRSGQELANSWFDAAIKQSKNPEQMTNSVFVIKLAAVHALATCLYNDMKDGKTDSASWLYDVKNSIAGVYEVMEAIDSSKFEKRQPGSEKQ